MRRGHSGYYYALRGNRRIWRSHFAGRPARRAWLVAEWERRGALFTERRLGKEA